MARWMLIAAASALLGTACSDEVAGSGGAGGSSQGAGGSGQGGGGSSQGAGGSVPVEEDLFACDPSLACPPTCLHIGYGDCGGDATCAGALWTDGEAGAVMLEVRPGPGGFMADELIVLLGDGTATRQRRARSCDFPCDPTELPWHVEPQETCTVAPSPCEAGTSCNVFPEVTDCTPLEPPWACADLETQLGG